MVSTVATAQPGQVSTLCSAGATTIPAVIKEDSGAGVFMSKAYTPCPGTESGPRGTHGTFKELLIVKDSAPTGFFVSTIRIP
jgi:hypothetical protein